MVASSRMRMFLSRIAQLGTAPDVAVVHDDAAFDLGSCVDAHAASQNRLPHQTAGKNASP
jgi:hypothetical protein